MSTDLAALSLLLDQGLDLDDDARDRWLQTLPAEHRHLAPELQTLLRNERSGSQSSFLAEFPPLPVTVAVDARVAGDRIGPFRLLRQIGRGGTSVVWLADQPMAPETVHVALKLPRHGKTDVAGCAFVREARLLASVDHPGIAKALDAHCGPEQPYLATSFVNGRPLDAWFGACSGGVDARLTTLARVVDAVSHLHERRIVHRDLKPANVLVTEDGAACLIDLGIAARFESEATDTAAGMRSFTPGYAAPEQVEGVPPAPTADVYSLGVLLCEALVDPAVAAEARRVTRPAGALRRVRPELLGIRLLEAAEAVGGPNCLTALARCALDPHPPRRPPDARAFSVALATAITEAQGGRHA